MAADEMPISCLVYFVSVLLSGHCPCQGFTGALKLHFADSEVEAAHANRHESEQGVSTAADMRHGGDAEEEEQQEEDEEEVDEVEDEEKIILRIKSSCHHEGLKLRIGVKQPLKRLFKGYKGQGNKAGWLPEGAAVTFKFDGDVLNGNCTPEAIEMENEDVIDACW